MGCSSFLRVLRRGLRGCFLVSCAPRRVRMAQQVIRRWVLRIARIEIGRALLAAGVRAGLRVFRVARILLLLWDGILLVLRRGILLLLRVRIRIRRWHRRIRGNRRWADDRRVRRRDPRSRRLLPRSLLTGRRLLHDDRLAWRWRRRRRGHQRDLHLLRRRSGGVDRRRRHVVVRYPRRQQCAHRCYRRRLRRLRTPRPAACTPATAAATEHGTCWPYDRWLLVVVRVGRQADRTARTHRVRRTGRAEARPPAADRPPARPSSAPHLEASGRSPFGRFIVASHTQCIQCGPLGTTMTLPRRLCRVVRYPNSRSPQLIGRGLLTRQQATLLTALHFAAQIQNQQPDAGEDQADEADGSGHDPAGDQHQLDGRDSPRSPTVGPAVRPAEPARRPGRSDRCR